nr:hypothetical protein [uncultured Clostridium sp.]
MNIRYIYIHKYRNRVKNVNLNFENKYNYKFDNNYIKCFLNDDYVEDFYSEYEEIENLTAIIGKNASGKTTILRAINDIFSDEKSEIEYVIIFTKGKKDYLLYSFDDKRSIKFDEKLKFDIVINLNEKKVPNTVQDVLNEKVELIYYSGIFDKASPLSKNKYLADISTNRLVRDINLMEENEDEWKFDYQKSINFIDKFEMEEIERKVKYYLECKKYGFNNKFQLFDFPKSLRIMLTADKSEIKKIQENSRLKKAIQYYSEILELYRTDVSKMEPKEQIKIEFLLLMIIELLFKISEIYNIDTEIEIKELEGYLSEIKENGYGYNIEKFVNKIIEKYISISDKQKEYYKLLISNSNIYDEYKYMSEKLKVCLENLNNEDLDINSIYEYKDYSEMFNIIKKNLDEINLSIELITSSSILESGIFNDVDFIYQINQYINLNTEIDNILFRIEDSVKYDEHISEEILEEFFEYKRLSINYLNYFIEYIKNINSEVNIDKNNKKYIDEKCINFEEYINYRKILVNNFLNLVDQNPIKYNSSNKIYIIESTWKNDKSIEFIKSYYKAEIKNHIIFFNHEELSSGQKAYLDMFSRLVAIRKTISYETTELIILLDEGEIYLHPEIQIKFIYSLLELFKSFYGKYKIHLILTSNSPFIISDIPDSNVIYLEENNVIKDQRLKTFGANINDLLVNSFFMKEGTIGKYSLYKINKMIENLISMEKSNEVLSLEEEKKYRSIINYIGEPIIRKSILKKIELLRDNGSTIDEKIEFYKNEIRKLENSRRNY